ncbi:hypothetical protein G6011_05045 [Alternaria panax]|uniref:Uncharacterized protein n=1 Tax=Alternaria panax TaxID=48097 RepID=A0AAD4FGK0_9PLEO|nr:hypothetical protein G6011_05045 [Alternaria panax]
MKSAPTRPPRRPRETTIDSTIKPTNDAGNDKSGIVEHDLVNEDKHESVVSEALRSSFRQPGLTPQESSDLVFGTGSKVETRRKQQAGCIDDRIAPDVHEFASQIVRDDPLGEAEKMTEASSPSQKPYASGLENSPLGIREGEIPVESHAQVLANPSRTVTSTWVSRTNLPADALVPQYGNQNRSLKFGSLGGALQVAKHAQESQPFQEQPSHDVSTCKPGMFHAQAVTQFDRFALTAIPGTPPYTPQKGEPSHK